MKPPQLPHIKNFIPPGIEPILPSESAHQGLSVPEVIFTYGHKEKHIRNMPHIFPNLIKAFLNARKSYRSLRKNPLNFKTTADPEFFQDLEKYACSLGCSRVGYSEVPASYIFNNKMILFKNAIVLLMDMDKEKIRQAPHITAGKEVWRTYAALGSIVNKIAGYMRARGYRAEAGPAIGGEVNYPLLAQKAGLGHIGKHGMLISEGNGPSQRIAVVYTDIENLPFTTSERYQWIPAYCEKCNLCVNRCPAQAIYRNIKVLEDGSEVHMDYTRCAVPFSDSMGCSVCIKECTFFRNDFEKIEKVVQKFAAKRHAAE